MKSKHLAASLVSAALVTTPITPAVADAGDFIAGAIIGGVIGANAKKQKTRTRTVYKSTRAARPRLPSTQEGRQIQTSLNYFGFNAGRVDGQLGRTSRAAISSYQAHMGYPVTGHLSQYEKDFLLNSHARAQAGGILTSQQIAANPQGPRGLLHVYRDQIAAGNVVVSNPYATPQIAAGAVVPGTVVTSVPVPQGTVVTVAPAGQTAPQPPQTTTVAAAAPAEEAPAPSAAALPNFLGSATTASLASHCNGISLLTNSNGGFTTVSNMTDPHFALNEQFCLARTYAIKQGEDMSSKVAGVTPAQIAQQCAAFGPAMKDQIAAVSLQPKDDVIRATSDFILSTGMAPADLTGTAKICLSSGYRTDDLDVSLASSLMLVALGEQVYGELIGHHLSQGFGVSKRPDLAQGWYKMTTDALAAGAPGVFAPGQPERAALLQKASLGLAGGAPVAAAPKPAAASLPTFSTSGD
ncbi:peptidoglycan-binding protein [Aliishimia ponticola]|uniref:Peptidoglycan-binding protein n=1 Tax=Aliishimia ponticola TaxID=2499833 RepID=A0A4S4NFP1_9RHOB|nr:peptidoglycan-binding domain-containing protein [Aliishimia ponticola]THH37427.1 peptidoglycan-binding protein [Aliishimia ponticola]